MKKFILKLMTISAGLTLFASTYASVINTSLYINGMQSDQPYKVSFSSPTSSGDLKFQSTANPKVYKIYSNSLENGSGLLTIELPGYCPQSCIVNLSGNNRGDIPYHWVADVRNRAVCSANVMQGPNKDEFIVITVK